MRKDKAIKILKMYHSIDDDERNIFKMLYERIKRNIDANGALLVRNPRSIIYQRWNPRTNFSEFARKLKLTRKELETFFRCISSNGERKILSMNIDANEIDEYKLDVDIHDASMWAASHVPDVAPIEKLEEYGILRREELP